MIDYKNWEIGYIAAKEKLEKSNKIRSQKAIEEYYKNPNKCIFCGKIIKLKEGRKVQSARRKKHCSHSCAQKDLRSKGYLKHKEKNCLVCGKELSKWQYKYCSFLCQNEYSYKKYIKLWKDGQNNGNGGPGQLSKHIRRYILEKYKNKCCKCGWDKKNTYTDKIPLEVNHIDGNSENNKEENLELLCPNCHSLTYNYRNLNKGKGERIEF